MSSRTVIKESRFKRGFTLIELLVVIAIIALLAAILFPVFAQAREKARRSSCLSNVKQLSAAFQQYLQDFDERFPGTVTERQANDSARFGAVADTAAARAPFSIRAKLQTYTKSEQVFKCPSGQAWPAASAGRWYTTDYGFHNSEKNFTTGIANFETTWYQANPDFGFNEDVTLADLPKSAQFILTSDAARDDNTPSRGGLYPLQYVSPGSTSQANFRPRHQDGANVGFADGHAKWLKFEQTWKTFTDNYWRRNPS